MEQRSTSVRRVGLRSRPTARRRYAARVEPIGFSLCVSAFLGDALSSPFGLRFSVAPFVKPLPPSPSVARLRLIDGESELEPRRGTFHRPVQSGSRQRNAVQSGGVAR